ncbi:MAG: S9 family peptidase [Clostridiales bacterium]|jgi:dipeptidyl aminopeptidase/acylaminoacyl peptidase|nr:S9 family peptidase [Clostridiales bacterium]
MERVRLDDIKNFTYLGHLKYSPDGKKIAVLASKANDKNDYNQTVFVDKGCGFMPLTGLKGKAGNFIWLNDENILFSELRNKDDKDKVEKVHELTTFYKININGGEAVEAFRVDAVVTRVNILPNGKHILGVLFDNNRPSFDGKSPAEVDGLLTEMKKEKDYQIVDELPFWFNGKGFTNKKRSRIYTYCEKDGLRPLTEPLTNVSDYKISNCGKYILYTADVAPAEIHSNEGNVYLIDIENGETTPVLNGDMKISAFDFYNDKVFVCAADKDEYLHKHGDFYIVDPKTKEMNKLASPDIAIGSNGMSDAKFGGGKVTMVDGDYYYFIYLNGYKADVYRCCLKSGKIENITNCGGSMDFFDMKDGKIIAGVMPPSNVQEIYSFADGKMEKISSFNDSVISNRKVSEPIHHVLKDKEGVEFDGWVMYPVDYEKGKKYPAILNIHGGPKAAYCEAFYHEMQYWASCDYFVLFSNPRGSDGKGNEFADIRGKYGTIDYDNIMQFVDEMLEKYPDIDEKKMGVTGGSYGGFMTNWIIGHTNRFAAAATQRSISNWVSFGYVSDIGYYFGKDQMQADPWNNIDKLWWHSPLKYAENFKTPTLIIHSDEDYRCWIPEGYQLFTALKLHGVDTRMCVFHGENHELSRGGKPDHRMRRIQEITQWMDKYLK